MTALGAAIAAMGVDGLALGLAWIGALIGVPLLAWSAVRQAWALHRSDEEEAL